LFPYWFDCRNDGIYIASNLLIAHPFCHLFGTFSCKGFGAIEDELAALESKVSFHRCFPVQGAGFGSVVPVISFVACNMRVIGLTSLRNDNIDRRGKVK
jgi:hypothetical protein